MTAHDRIRLGPEFNGSAVHEPQCAGEDLLIRGDAETLTVGVRPREEGPDAHRC